jgi:Spy/CpxP family protein refolding chaperone
MRAQREAQAPIREQMRETHRKAGEEIHAILTPEQETQLRSIRRARMDELRREMRDRRGGEWRGQRGQRPPRGDSFRHRRGA